MKSILEKIERIHKVFPELRLGQIIISAGNNNNDNVFYTPDDSIERGLDEFIKKYKI